MNLENQHNTLERLGFSFERGGVHTARTMMLAEMRALLSFVNAADAAKADYLEAIQTANCLGKRSCKTRMLTFRHLADLYALNPSLLVFRALRFFWQRDVDGRPLVAALCAYSRDPMLRATAPFVLGLQEGATVTREAMEAFTRCGMDRVDRFVENIGDIRKLETALTEKLHQIKRYHVPEQEMLPLLCRAFDIKATKDVVEKQRRVDDLLALRDQAQSLTKESTALDGLGLLIRLMSPVPFCPDRG